MSGVPPFDNYAEPVSLQEKDQLPLPYDVTAPFLGDEESTETTPGEESETVAELEGPPGEATTRVRPISELTYGESPAPATSFEFALAANQMAVPDTRKYPWRASAALLISVPGHGQPFLATGWFIGFYAVITAGHVVYPREPGGHTGWASQIEVIPGLNGFPNPLPYGKNTSQSFDCPPEWRSHGDSMFDYGVVLLNQPVGRRVGTYGFANFTSSQLSGPANLLGYPRVSPDGSAPQGRQWYSGGNIGSVSPALISYNLPTRSGQSGGCVYRNIGGQTYALAIHTSNQGGLSRGIRIAGSVYAKLQQWRSMQG